MAKFSTSFFLKTRRIDIATGHPWVVILHEKDCQHFGLTAGYELTFRWQNKKTEVVVDVTNSLVKPGEIGLFKDILKRYHIPEGEIIELSFVEKPLSLNAIHKKLLGKSLSYKEIYSIVKDVVNYRLNEVEMAFFSAPFFNENILTLREIYHLTKAFCETGETLKFKSPVADKHSTGGLPGNRITPILVGIIASLGITIPKTSSRAITSASGTADTFEVLAPVTFTSAEIKKIVEKTNGCLVWGGALKLAPADDRFIRIFYQLGAEPYLKMIVSVMSKKIAVGTTHLVIDIPVGPTAKIPNFQEAKKIKKYFLYLAKLFKIKTKVIINKALGPVGRGIGPGPEARDILRVLQQKADRPLDLERKSIKFAGALLSLVKKISEEEGEKLAYQALRSGNAWKKMQEIILHQGGKIIDAEEVKLGKITFKAKSAKTGTITAIHNKNLVEIARLLGAPNIKEAGVYLNKTIGEKIKKGEVFITLYTVSKEKLNTAISILDKLEIFFIK